MRPQWSLRGAAPALALLGSWLIAPEANAQHRAPHPPAPRPPQVHAPQAAAPRVLAHPPAHPSASHPASHPTPKPHSNLNPSTNPTAIVAARPGVGHPRYSYRSRPHSVYRPRHFAVPRPRTSPQMAAFARLVQDLGAIPVRGPVTPAQATVLRSDLTAIEETRPHADPAAVGRLSEHLVGALTRRRLLEWNPFDLAAPLKLVMNAPRLPAGGLNEALHEGETALKTTGVPQADIQTLMADLRSVAVSATQAQGIGHANVNASAGPANRVR